MSASASIGQRITQLIEHLGVSKNAFAQSLDKTATVIQHLVDERNKPGYDLLCKIFKVYPNVSKDWLMEGSGPMLKADLLASEGPTAASLAPAAPPTADLLAALAPRPEVPSAPAASPHPVVAAVAPPPVVAALAPAQLAEIAPPVAPTPAPPAAVALPIAPAPDPAYLTVALQTQYMQHQLALAEQRNQHLLEQQALLKQLVEVLQGR